MAGSEMDSVDYVDLLGKRLDGRFFTAVPEAESISSAKLDKDGPSGALPASF